MKRVAVLLLVGAMTFGMSSCGNRTDDDDSGTDGGNVTIEFFGWGDAAEQETIKRLSISLWKTTLILP